MSGGRAVGPAPPHTDWHHHLHHGTWAAGCRAWPHPASRGEERCPCPLGMGGEAGRHLHQQPRPGRPQHSAGLRLLHLAGPRAAPAQGGGQLLLVPNSTGHTAIYLGVGPAPLASPAVHFRKSRTLCPPSCPSSSARGPSAASGVCSRTQVTDTPLVQGPLPAVPRGWVPAHSPDPSGGISVEAPSKMGWGPSPSPPQPPLFYLCFCLQIGVGSSRGAGQHSLLLGVTRRVLARAHLEWDSTSPVTPPRTTL